MVFRSTSGGLFSTQTTGRKSPKLLRRSEWKRIEYCASVFALVILTVPDPGMSER
jgi:hypothetical protein